MTCPSHGGLHRSCLLTACTSPCCASALGGGSRQAPARLAPCCPWTGLMPITLRTGAREEGGNSGVVGAELRTWTSLGGSTLGHTVCLVPEAPVTTTTNSALGTMEICSWWQVFTPVVCRAPSLHRTWARGFLAATSFQQLPVLCPGAAYSQPLPPSSGFWGHCALD